MASLLNFIPVSYRDMGYLGGNFKMRFLLVVLFVLFAPAPQALAQGKGYTLDEDLLYRINFGSAEDVRVLLGKGANPNARTKQGETALEVALERNDAEASGMALALIDKGASIDTADKNGNPIIIDAIRYKQTKVVKDLMERGVDFHTKSVEGIPLIEYAKVAGDQEVIKLIQDLTDKENAYMESLRDPNRFKDIVKIYTMDSCVYQYWSFFLSSRQSPEKDTETKKKIEDIKHTIYQLIGQIQQYYASASTQALHNISSKAVQNIYNALNDMVSNSNRADNGVGTDEDAKARCTKVVDRLNIEFVPAVLSSSAPVNTPSASSRSAAPPPLPVDPKAAHQ